MEGERTGGVWDRALVAKARWSLKERRCSIVSNASKSGDIGPEFSLVVPLLILIKLDLASGWRKVS